MGRWSCTRVSAVAADSPNFLICCATTMVADREMPNSQWASAWSSYYHLSHTRRPQKGDVSPQGTLQEHDGRLSIAALVDVSERADALPC